MAKKKDLTPMQQYMLLMLQRLNPDMRTDEYQDAAYRRRLDEASVPMGGPRVQLPVRGKPDRPVWKRVGIDDADVPKA